MCKPTLYWNADNVSRLMECRNIPHRKALATAINRPISTVYRTFDEHWSGGVSVEVLAAMSITFDVPVSWLVRDPRGQ